MQFWKWLYPGLGVKRWLLVIFGGVLLMSAGLAWVVNVELLAAIERETRHWLGLLLSWLPEEVAPAAGAVTGALGLALVVLGLRGMVYAVVSAAAPHRLENLAEVVYNAHHLRRGPKVVAIGGGTGLSTMLRGLKQWTSNITAIVTVADDGGSSGRLREELGVLPPGDIRNTLVALADTEALMEQLFQYRFPSGNGLKGHSFGNLFIAAMTDITGDFEQAVRESSKVLAVRGRVLPSTLDSVVLRAEYEDGGTAVGESQIPQPGRRIRRVYLEPADARPLDDALRALREADVIVLGPGSLYTSVLPNLLVPGIADAIRESQALRIYVCNVMTQPGETDGYRASDHLRALFDHVGPGIVDYALLHRGRVHPALEEKYRRTGQVLVIPDVKNVRALGVVPVTRFLVSQTELVRHDSALLARAIEELWQTHRARRGRGRSPLLEWLFPAAPRRAGW
ncbi:MAG: YvcK family protein [Bacillota bacterium]